MNDMSKNIQYVKYSNNLDEEDTIYGSNSHNTGMTETEKNELTLVMVYGNGNQIVVAEPMDTSEEGFELVEIENCDDPHLTGCNACESCKKKWEDEKANLEMLLEEEKQKVETVEIFWANKIKEMKEKAENELLKYNTDKGNWEKEMAKLRKSLEEEKQKVETVEIFWANKIKEMKEEAENELLKYNTDKGNWEKETAKLRQRLSSIAADMLAHGNVNVVNLSDADRPTKLQEAYSELYDNEWTDAFEELTDKRIPDKDVVMILLDILMSSFQKCREITWGRYEKLRYVASTVEILQRSPISVDEKLCERHSVIKLICGSRSTYLNVATENVGSGDPDVSGAWKDKFEDENEKRLQCTIDLGIDLEKEIKDIWRKTTVALKENLIEHIYSVIETCQTIPINGCPMTSKYLKSCINLCWKMGVQERPMHLDTVAEMDDNIGKKFDTSKFRAYTRSGENVAFVVWPALFLNEGGPMLAKGIAQGSSNDEKQN